MSSRSTKMYANVKIDRNKIIDTFKKTINTHLDSESESDDVDYYSEYSDSSESGYEHYVKETEQTGGAKNRQTEQSEYRQLGRSKFVSEEVDLPNNKSPINREIILNAVPNFSNIQPKLILHEDVDYPKFSLGFNHWVHASKNKTDVFKTFINKKKVYRVVNGYEMNVDDYDESIGAESNKFFKGKPNVISKDFYKLWEMLFYYDLIDVKSKNFVSAHIAEKSGSFSQATTYFRDLYSDSKNDKYHVLSSKKLDNAKTYDSKFITTKTIEDFKKNANSVDLVTGDGGYQWTVENIQEQESATLIFSQILTALNIQKKGGNFVLRMFETFTTISLKFIVLLKYFYDTVNIVKPLTSREDSSERYIVCMGFKDTKNKDDVQKLMKVLADIEKANAGRDKLMFMHDIFDIELPADLIINMISINTELSNRQFSVINKMIEYLEGSNFYGELYMRYRTRQVDLTKFWINTFLSKEYDETKIKAKQMLETAKRHQTTEADKFKTKLIGYSAEPSVKADKKIARAKTTVKAKAKPKSKSKEKNTKK